MGFYDKIIGAAKDSLRSAYNKTFGSAKGFADTATGIRNSAFESTPELVETAHQGVQISTEFIARHVDVELVEAEAGKYLGVNDDSQPFGTQEVLQDSEVDTTFTEENFYQTQPVCARIVLPYAWLVRWFHIQNFLNLVLNALRISRGNGYVRLGWWGQYRKANTLAQSEPLGKRIIIGWLQWLINNGATQVKGITLAGGDTAKNIRLDRRDYVVDPINIGSFSETGTKGTGSAYVTDTPNLAGVTSIALITGSGTILAGDEVMFAGDDTRYAVTTGITAPGTIVITPALKVGHGDATAVSIVTETAADYANLDIPVLDAIQELIPAQFHENLRIVVGIGIYNFLTKRAIAIVTAAANGIVDANALPQYTANLNIAGYPVVLDKTAPANMILITRTSDGSSNWANTALSAAMGLANNPLLSNSNLVLLRHVKMWKAMMDLAFKSKIVDFSWESIFYGMRHHKAAVLFHPDAIRFFNGTSYKASAVQWQLTKYDEAIAD